MGACSRRSSAVCQIVAVFTSALPWLAFNEGNTLNLNQSPAWQFRNSDSRASGRNVSKIAGIDGIHGLKIVHICQKDRCFNDIMQGGSGSFEHGLQVLYDTMR